MSQHPIDLLPPAIRARSQAGIRAGQAVASIASALALVIVLVTHARLEHNQAEKQLGTARAQADQVLEMERKAEELREVIAEHDEYIQLYEQVALPLEISGVIATIINELPTSMTLDRLDISAGAQRVVRSARSRSSGDGEAAPRLLVGEIAGFAVTDADIAALVDVLNRRSPFERVSLDFSRTRSVREKAAREFRVSFEIDLEARYEVRETPSRLTAAGDEQGSGGHVK